MLRGGDGDDVLDGGWGKDRLIGGAGEDTFVVDHGSKTKVVDFEQDADLFLIETGASGFAELELHEKRNGDLVVKYEGDQVVRIKDAEAGDFDQHDFMFG